jgi:hypothetical protein
LEKERIRNAGGVGMSIKLETICSNGVKDGNESRGSSGKGLKKS